MFKAKKKFLSWPLSVLNLTFYEGDNWSRVANFVDFVEVGFGSHLVSDRVYKEIKSVLTSFRSWYKTKSPRWKNTLYKLTGLGFHFWSAIIVRLAESLIQDLYELNTDIVVPLKIKKSICGLLTIAEIKIHFSKPALEIFF